MKIPVITLAFVFTATALHAQISSVNVTASGSGSSGTGAKILWYPGKNAFRAGLVSGTQWNDANVGTSSAAFGESNTVSGAGGFASGAANNVGYGWWSSAFGGANVISNASQAFVAGGNNLVNNGYNNFIAGGYNTVSQSSSMALGESNTSAGYAAMTFGRGLTSASAGCVVVGLANTPIIGNDTYWVGTDPVFIVGNGTGGSPAAGQSGPVQSNALVVYKNGDIKVPKTQGDISMGEFGP
jgi:hypothetical protein